MKRSRGIAVSGVFSALAVVVMWLGALSGLGTYASPLMAGVALIPVGLLLGKRTQGLSFAAVSLLCLLLSADWEENLLFIGLFGWYPILRPGLAKIKNPLRLAVKLLIFNVMSVSMELLVMRVLVPQSEKTWILILLLVTGNITFLLYDRLLPRLTILLARRLKLR